VRRATWIGAFGKSALAMMTTYGAHRARVGLPPQWMKFRTPHARTDRRSLRTMLRYLGHSAVSGVIGWVALMAAFEGAYWAQAYLTHLRRDAR
jgi:anti-sigma factor RsiW